MGLALSFPLFDPITSHYLLMNFLISPRYIHIAFERPLQKISSTTKSNLFNPLIVKNLEPIVYILHNMKSYNSHLVLTPLSIMAKLSKNFVPSKRTELTLLTQPPFPSNHGVMLFIMQSTHPLYAFTYSQSDLKFSNIRHQSFMVFSFFFFTTNHFSQNVVKCTH